MLRTLQCNLLVLSLSLALVASCTDDDSVAPEPTEEPTVDTLTTAELCELRVVFDSLENTDTTPYGPFCWDVSLDEASSLTAADIARGCRSGTEAWAWAEALLAAEAAGRVTIAHDKAAECIEKVQVLKSSVRAIVLAVGSLWDNLREQDCAGLVHGRATDGQPCIDDWDCAAATSGCYTRNPFEEGSNECLPVGEAGNRCSSWWPCGPGLECLGDICQAAAATTGGSPGDPCFVDTECAGECVYCRMDAAGVDGDGVCTRLGQQGAACVDRSGCLYDLDCISRICRQRRVGDACEPEDGFCTGSAACLSLCWEHDLNPEACEADTECEPAGNLCEPKTGSTKHYACTALPAQGDCLIGLCQAGHYCDAMDSTCWPQAELGQLCDSRGETAPPCAGDLLCLDEICEARCLSSDSCDPGFYCNPVTGACASIHNGRCRDSEECGPDHYCQRCDYLDDHQACMNAFGCIWSGDRSCEHTCATFDNDPSPCSARPECRYQSWGDCQSVCATIGGDATACAAQPTCLFDPQANGYCQPEANCSSFPNPDTCNAEPACGYSTLYSACVPICWALDEGLAACEGNPACRWQYGSCWSVCNTSEAGNVDVCEVNYPGLCRWSWYASCVDNVSCATIDQETDCDAQPTCSHQDQGSCTPIGSAASFACLSRFDIGESCLDDAMCSSNTCVRDPDGSLVCAQAVPEQDNGHSSSFVGDVIMNGAH